MSHAANANCKCSVRSRARAPVCVSSTRGSLDFYFAAAGEKVHAGWTSRCANLLFSHLAGIPIQRCRKLGLFSAEAARCNLWGGTRTSQRSQRQQCKFQANYLTIATLSAMTATRTIHGSSKLFCAATSAPPTSIDDCAINFVVYNARNGGN